MDTNRTQYREAVAQIAAKAQAKLPECNGRVEKAVGLVLQGDVELHADGTVTVHSQTDPTRHYRIVAGSCMCQDWKQAPHHFCKHRLAAGIARRVQEMLPPVVPAPEVEMPEGFEPSPDNDAEGDLEPLPPVPAPTAPLPEAPVSITLKATLHGHEVLVTLRGTDFASVKTQVEAASAWLQAQAPSQPQGQGAAVPQCPTHGPLKPSTKGKGYYCPQKLQDGSWCKGK